MKGEIYMGKLMEYFDSYVNERFPGYAKSSISVLALNRRKRYPYKRNKEFMEQYRNIIEKKRNQLKQETLLYFFALLKGAGIEDSEIKSFGQKNLLNNFDNLLADEALLNAINEIEKEGRSLSESSILDQVEKLDFTSLIVIPLAIRSCKVAIEEIEDRRNPPEYDDDEYDEFDEYDRYDEYDDGEYDDGDDR